MPLHARDAASAVEKSHHSASAPASGNDSYQDHLTKVTDSTEQHEDAATGSRAEQAAAASSSQTVSVDTPSERVRGRHEQGHPPLRRGGLATKCAQADALGSPDATDAAPARYLPQGRTVEGAREEEEGDPRLSPGTRSGASPAPLAEEDLKPGPVFVPIMLCMDDSDHELLVQEWHACHAVGAWCIHQTASALMSIADMKCAP